MLKIIDWVNRNKSALVMGVVVALLVASPQIRAWYTVGPENFEGVYPMFSDDEVTYLARIKEVTEGNFAVGNPYLREHMSDPFIMPPIAEWSIAFFAWATGASVPLVTNVGDFVLSILNFILVYILFATLTKGSRWIALFYTVLFFFFWLATFGRPISPQFNALFLWAGLIATARIYFVSGADTRTLHLTAGLIAGITCFISPYYFTTLLAFYALVSLARALSLRSTESLKKSIPWFFVTFLPLTMLYAYFQLLASGDPSYGETVLRYGLMHTHIPGSFTNMVLGGFALVVLSLSYGALSLQKFAFGVATVLTVWALNWQNIITGKSLQFSSHYLLVTVALVFVVLALVHKMLVAEEGQSLSRYRRGAIALGMALTLFVIGHNQLGEYQSLREMPYTRAELLREQEKRAVFDWFNTNTPKDSVVYSLGGGYDFLLPVYTENRVFYNFYAALYPAPDTETEERWLIQELFNPEMDTATIRERQREFWGNKYIDSYQSRENRKKIIAKLTGNQYVRGELVPESEINRVHSRWLSIQAQPINDSLSRYEIEYILLSKDYPYWGSAKARLDTMEGVALVATFGSEWVYTRRDPL